MLAQYGQELEKMLKILVDDFPAGFANFQRVKRTLINSYEVSGDLTSVGERLAAQRDWTNAFTGAGLQLLTRDKLTDPTQLKVADTFVFVRP